MKKYANRKSALMLAIALAALVSTAHAGPGAGCPGRDCPRYAGNFAPDCRANMTEEQLEKAHGERQAFFSATAEIRRKLLEKDMEFQSVLVKQEPDVDKLKALQKEISELEARLDEKWLAHFLEMKKINPDAGKGCAARYFDKYGQGRAQSRGPFCPGWGRHDGWRANCPRY